MSDQVYVVWTEIPVSDMEKSMAFYNKVFGWSLTLDTSGPVPMAMFGGEPGVAGGHLYPGKSGAGPTVHIAIPDDLEAATERAKAAGATIGMGPIEIPPGRFTVIEDLDGNSIGLFEQKKAA